MRRLVHDSTAGSLHRSLIEAGRSAEPADDAKRALLEALAVQGIVNAGALTDAGSHGGHGRAPNEAGAGNAAAKASSAGMSPAAPSTLGAGSLGTWSVGKGLLLAGVVGVAGIAGIWQLGSWSRSPDRGAELQPVPSVVPMPSTPSSALPASEERPEAAPVSAPAASQSVPAPDATSAEPGTVGARERSSTRRATPRKPGVVQSARPRSRGKARSASRTPPVRPANAETIAPHDGIEPPAVQHTTPASEGAAHEALVPSSSPPPGDATSASHADRGLSDTLLKAELAALEAVRRALEAGDTDRARRLLAAYSRRFPDGYLAPEAARLDGRIRSSGDRTP